MPMSRRDCLLEQIRRIALQGTSERRTDGQLLEHFIAERDQAAFALLLRRHGPMVWSVCRRILGNPHDADDAFQAAFLVLVRKANSIRPREAVGNWLYGVAYRTALEARGRLARQRAKEKSLEDVPQPESKPEENDQELWSVLDRELSQLSDKYRLPIVLCDLEGRSRKEVAQQLAIPEGTLSSRLATARKKLAARLARLGFTLSGVSLAALLTEKTATAGMAASLFMTTTKAAILVAAGPMAVTGVVSATVSTLTEGVLKTMLIAKIKTATLVLCGVAALSVGTSGVYYQTRARASDSQQLDRVGQDIRQRPAEGAEQEIDKLKRKNDDLRKALDVARIAKEGLRLKLTLVEAEAAVLRAELGEKKQWISALQDDVELKEREAKEQKRKEKAAGRALPKIEPPVRLQSQNAATPPIDFDARIDQLQGELSLLEETHRKSEELFNRKRAELNALIANSHRPKPPRPPLNRVDKLDQVLERLERLEKRLDRLERGGSKELPKHSP